MAALALAPWRGGAARRAAARPAHDFARATRWPAGCRHLTCAPAATSPTLPAEQRLHMRILAAARSGCATPRRFSRRCRPRHEARNVSCAALTALQERARPPQRDGAVVDGADGRARPRPRGARWRRRRGARASSPPARRRRARDALSPEAGASSAGAESVPGNDPATFARHRKSRCHESTVLYRGGCAAA